MANIKSAKKRIDTIKRQRTENKLIKSSLSTSIKKFKKLLASNELDKAEVQLKETISLINKAQSKGVLHKNNASNKVAKLSSALNKCKSNGKVEVVEEKPVKKEVKVAEPVVATEEKKETKKAAAAKSTKATTKETKATKPAKTSKVTKAETAEKKTEKKTTKKEA